MGLHILYFASLRESLGCTDEHLDPPIGVTTVGELRAFLAQRGEPWDALTRSKNLCAAVNQSMAAPETPVRDGDEIAFFPPVTGG